MKVFFWIVFMLSLYTSPMIIGDLVNVNVREYVGWEWLFVIISFSLSIAGFVYLLKGRWFEKINQKQKIVLAIFIPIIIFFIALIIANSVGFGDPFNWENIWYIWMLYFIFCGIFEYRLFADKKER